MAAHEPGPTVVLNVPWMTDRSLGPRRHRPTSLLAGVDSVEADPSTASVTDRAASDSTMVGLPAIE